jgi:glycosyltransferase involved in cell wall biosynthesis
MSARYPNLSLSIVIPAYNEEENIERVVENSLERLPEYFDDFEVIVVDDGSSDDTAKICDELAKKHQKLRIIHQKNGGFSRATLTGINASTKEFIAYIPADGQFLVEDLRHCFEMMAANDLVLGYRGGRPDYTLWRMLMTHGYLLLLTILFDLRVGDLGWATLWRADKLKGLDLKGSSGVFILAEIVVRFSKKGYRIAEAPSFYHPRAGGEVKNAKMSVVLKTLGNALKLWFLMKAGRM